MDGKVVANIVIAGRSYRMKIAAEDEEIFRNAEVFIKNRMEYYFNEHSDKDTQDRLAIALLNVTGKMLENQEINDSRRSKIEEIDLKLGLYLEKQGSLDNME
ncbi:MAG: cell division protein ZapA [Prevotellaceae bacterium]|jgi:cell division protein ZapA (FtsZ GTPase activity inhibitor)|nr:cell division protein ZapA [Prevotellaceae bacterium]